MSYFCHNKSFPENLLIQTTKDSQLFNHLYLELSKLFGLANSNTKFTLNKHPPTLRQHSLFSVCYLTITLLEEICQQTLGTPPNP